MTPADELRAAADQLHTLADAVVGDDWYSDLAGLLADSYPHAQTPSADAAFIAAMSPDLARAIATWLWETARLGNASFTMAAALAVARAVPKEVRR